MSYDLDPVFGCRLSTGRRDHDGYAFHGRTRAHIAAWEAEHGPVPDGMEVQHDCKRRACCNVAHLRLVTRVQNERLKYWRNIAREKKCSRGHDLSINAMVTPEGGRVCRTCTREAAHAVR
jgi:hypothetical protein